jgi:hypothetical protein
VELATSLCTVITFLHNPFLKPLLLSQPNAMLSSWFGSAPSTTESLVYEELPTPTTKEQFIKTVHDVKNKMLSLLNETGMLESVARMSVSRFCRGLGSCGV